MTDHTFDQVDDLAPPEPEWITLEEAQRKTGVSEQEFWSWIRRGAIRPIHHGGHALVDLYAVIDLAMRTAGGR